jgi:hypothetical protein
VGGSRRARTGGVSALHFIERTAVPVATCGNHNIDDLPTLVARLESEGATIKQVIPVGDRWTVLYDAPATKIEVRRKPGPKPRIIDLPDKPSAG